MILEEMRQNWAKWKPAGVAWELPLVAQERTEHCTVSARGAEWLPSAPGICSLSQRCRLSPPVCFQNELVLLLPD